jgi:serine/threonine-protein kinase
MTDPEVGRLIGGKFVIEGILGRGGMGVVYAARNMDLDQRVAVKCLLPEFLDVPEILERFAREARAAVRIQGEHVARVLDVGRSEDGVPFIVMEYLEGHDLAQELLTHGALGIAEAVTYILQACEAIAQAHALRIVHRDLKPSNLFLAATPGRNPFVKVLDFGISKVVDPKSSQLTKTTTLMGTPYYMSPEQLLAAKTVDERSDIWSLGVILYELLTAISPFAAETGPEVVAKIVHNEPVPPSTLRCLQAKPDARFQDVGALALALAPFAAPGDRPSIDAISRVVSVSLQALAASDTVVAQSSSSVLPPAPSSLPASVRTPAPSRPVPAARTLVRNLVDTVEPQPRRGGLAVVTLAGAALFVAVCVVAVTKLASPGDRARVSSQGSGAGSGVAPPPAAPSVPAPVIASDPLPSSSAASAPRPPSTGASTSEIPAPLGRVASQPSPPLAPGSSATPPHVAPPAASTEGPVTPVASTPEAPKPVPPPRVSAPPPHPPKKNPLDIPIQ